MSRFIIVAIMFITLIMSICSHALSTKDGEHVMLQASIILDDPFYQGRTVEKDVIIRLRAPTPGDLAQTILWEKQYIKTPIANGAIGLNLEGEDMHGKALIADMFDEYDIWMEVEIDGRSVNVKMVSYPYVVKSRISDETHDAKALQGVKIQPGIVSDGDWLVVSDGQWVATSNRRAGKATDTNNQLGGLSDVSLPGNTEPLTILGYDGSQWVPVNDQKLTADDVDRIATNEGYLKSENVNQISEGIYDQITGIGGTVKADPISGVIQLQGKVNIDGDMIVGGKLGAASLPIKQVHVDIINVKRGGSDIELFEANQQLNVTQKINIQDKLGSVLTGKGKAKKIGVFKDKNEMTYHDDLILDNGQLGVGGISDKVDLSGEKLKLNVEGGIRVSNAFVLRDKEIVLSDYVTKDELDDVALSGRYEHLNSAIPVHTYVTESILDQLLMPYASTIDVDTDIDERITAFKQSGLGSSFQTKLSSYDTTSIRNEKLASALAQYYTIEDADNRTIDHSEFSLALENYYTESEIKDKLRQHHVNDISVLGLTGEFSDLIDPPNWALKNDIDQFNQDVIDDYSRSDYSSAIILEYGDKNIAKMMTDIHERFVSTNQLSELAYATEETVNALHTVARTGRYSDLEGSSIPDLSGLMKKTDIDNTYIDEAELSSKVSDYILSSDIHQVGKEGRYSDLINKPDMSSYYTAVTINDNFLKKDQFETDMASVVKFGSDSDLDMSVFATINEMNQKITDYTTTDDLAAVALSGKYSDLIFDTGDRASDESIIDIDQLKNKLETEYVTIATLRETAKALNDVYYDEDELASRLDEFKDTDVQSKRAATLQNYYTKAEFSDELKRRMDEFRSTTMNDSIVAGFEPYVSSDELAAKMQDYPVNPGEYNDFIRGHFNEYWSIDEMDQRQYVKYTNNTEIHNPSGFVGIGVMPKGSIIFWYKGEIPSGWEEVVVDTPAAGGRFIIGSGSGYSIGQTGGLASISLTGSQLPSHGHGVSNVTTESKTHSTFEHANHTHSDSINNSHDDVHNHPTNGGQRMHDNDTAHTHTAGKGESKSTVHNHSGSTNDTNSSHAHPTTINSSNPSNHGHNAISSNSGGGAHSVNIAGWSFASKVNVGTNGDDDHYSEIKGANFNLLTGSIADTGHRHTAKFSNAGGHTHSVNSGGGHTHGFNKSFSETTSHGHAKTKVTINNNNNADKTHSHASVTLGTESASHKHTVTINKHKMNHSHGFNHNTENKTHNHTVSTSNEGSNVAYDNRPPYFKLKLIVKKIN